MSKVDKVLFCTVDVMCGCSNFGVDYEVPLKLYWVTELQNVTISSTQKQTYRLNIKNSLLWLILSWLGGICYSPDDKQHTCG